MKMEFKISVTVQYDENGLHKTGETQRKLDDAINHGIDIIQNSSISLLPTSATVKSIKAEADINFYNS